MRPLRSSSLNRYGIALALGLLGLAPGSVGAQYFEGAWAYSDLGSGYGGFQGAGLPGDSAPGFNFGAPGFSDGGMTPFTSFGSNPYFDMGTRPPGVEGEVAAVSGYIGNDGYGYEAGSYQRAHYRPRTKAKAKVRRPK
jgi:hypothetical protein